MMPRKQRLLRSKAIREAADALGPIPDYIPKQGADGGNQAAENLGIYSGGLVRFDGEGNAFLHENIGLGGRDSQNADKGDRIQRLKKKYQALWGTREGAGIIARLESLAPQTVRRYFKASPK